ncbi:unnamed protein product [Amoebophrya sp. A25]|nr:unnamed protein product [Amoebophrya sp. A25]|eukprot:GSA25T00001598001.1
MFAEGASFNDFRIVQELGRGSFGTVYKAKWKSSTEGLTGSEPQFLVLKRIDFKPWHQEKHRQAAKKEVQMLAKVRHPNVIRYFGSFTYKTSFFICMEYASKGDMHQFIQKRQRRQAYLAEELLWRFAEQLVSAIAHLHSHSIIHRDLKPLNVFLAENDTVKVGDLGVSKLAEEFDQNHTRVGTPLYLAPEQIKHQGYDFKVDIWALGCLLYLLTALEPPFHGQNLIQLGNDIVRRNPRSLSQSYSQEWRTLVSQLLTKRAPDRPDIFTVEATFQASIAAVVMAARGGAQNNFGHQQEEGKNDVTPTSGAGTRDGRERRGSSRTPKRNSFDAFGNPPGDPGIALQPGGAPPAPTDLPDFRGGGKIRPMSAGGPRRVLGVPDNSTAPMMHAGNLVHKNGNGDRVHNYSRPASAVAAIAGRSSSRRRASAAASSSRTSCRKNNSQEEMDHEESCRDQHDPREVLVGRSPSSNDPRSSRKNSRSRSGGTIRPATAGARVEVYSGAGGAGQIHPANGVTVSTVWLRKQQGQHAPLQDINAKNLLLDVNQESSAVSRSSSNSHANKKRPSSSGGILVVGGSSSSTAPPTTAAAAAAAAVVQQPERGPEDDHDEHQEHLYDEGNHGPRGGVTWMKQKNESKDARGGGVQLQQLLDSSSTKNITKNRRAGEQVVRPVSAPSIRRNLNPGDGLHREEHPQYAAVMRRANPGGSRRHRHDQHLRSEQEEHKNYGREEGEDRVVDHGYNYTSYDHDVAVDPADRAGGQTSSRSPQEKHHNIEDDDELHQAENEIRGPSRSRRVDSRDRDTRGSGATYSRRISAPTPRSPLCSTLDAEVDNYIIEDDDIEDTLRPPHENVVLVSTQPQKTAGGLRRPSRAGFRSRGTEVAPAVDEDEDQLQQQDRNDLQQQHDHNDLHGHQHYSTTSSARNHSTSTSKQRNAFSISARPPGYSSDHHAQQGQHYPTSNPADTVVFRSRPPPLTSQLHQNAQIRTSIFTRPGSAKVPSSAVVVLGSSSSIAGGGAAAAHQHQSAPLRSTETTPKKQQHHLVGGGGDSLVQSTQQQPPPSSATSLSQQQRMKQKIVGTSGGGGFRGTIMVDSDSLMQSASTTATTVGTVGTSTTTAAAASLATGGNHLFYPQPPQHSSGAEMYSTSRSTSGARVVEQCQNIKGPGGAANPPRRRAPAAACAEVNIAGDDELFIVEDLDLTENPIDFITSSQAPGSGSGGQHPGGRNSVSVTSPNQKQHVRSSISSASSHSGVLVQLPTSSSSTSCAPTRTPYGAPSGIGGASASSSSQNYNRRAYMRYPLRPWTPPPGSALATPTASKQMGMKQPPSSTATFGSSRGAVVRAGAPTPSSRSTNQHNEQEERPREHHETSKQENTTTSSTSKTPKATSSATSLNNKSAAKLAEQIRGQLVQQHQQMEAIQQQHRRPWSSSSTVSSNSKSHSSMNSNLNNKVVPVSGGIFRVETIGVGEDGNACFSGIPRPSTSRGGGKARLSIHDL